MAADGLRLIAAQTLEPVGVAGCIRGGSPKAHPRIL